MSGVNVASEPSLNVTVAAPSFPTTTFATFPGFASSIAFLTASFSACVKFAGSATGVLAGSLIPSASFAALVTNSDNDFLSVEPSVYVTTRFPALSFSTDLILGLASSASTAVPFLSAKLASSLVWAYSICNFSLILAKSSSVTLAGFATSTFSVGVLISYLSVWDLTMNWTYPGVWVAFGFLSNALKSVFDGALSLSLATTKLVHLFGAVSVVTPVILIVAVAPDTVPSPCVTAEFSIFPVVKP